VQEQGIRQAAAYEELDDARKVVRDAAAAAAADAVERAGAAEAG